VASDKDVSTDLPVPVDFDAPVGWSPVALFESARQAHEAGLAILAMGQAYWLLPHENNYIICVASGELPAVRRELEIMRGMGHRSPRSEWQAPYEELSASAWSFVVYAILLSAIFVGQFFLPLKSAGGVDAVKMLEGGEWWRALTALTLHGDVVHLVSNMVAGIGFAFLLSRFFGAGAAWLLILITGGVGNALNAWIHYPEAHLSIGASTAVFGGLGLITGVGLWVALMQPAERWTMPRWLVPTFGGLTLLGLLGVGEGLEGRIDVAAHISGFICGSAAGFLCATRQPFFVRVAASGRWIGVFVIVLLGLAWSMAFQL